MLKLELTHVFRKLENGQTDYHSQMIEFDYSHLNEERRDVVVHKFTYEGKEESTSKTYVTFGRGLVLEYKSTYIGDGDSVGAIAVWDPIDKQPVWFGTGYEQMSRNPHEIHEYDATPEVKAEYDAWRKVQEMERLHQVALYEDRSRTEAIELEKITPTKGKMVKVVRGRKVAIGTFGKVFWYGKTPYGQSVGLIINGKDKVFTSAHNVEVVPDNLTLVENLAKERGLI